MCLAKSFLCCFTTVSYKSQKTISAANISANIFHFRAPQDYGEYSIAFLH